MSTLQAQVLFTVPAFCWIMLKLLNHGKKEPKFKDPCQSNNLLIDASLSSYHEEATVSLSFGQILTRLGLDHFSKLSGWRLTSFLVNLLLVQSH